MGRHRNDTSLPFPFQDHLVNVLLKSGKKDSWWRTRSLALCTLALYLYHELANQTFHTKVNEAVNVLLASLKVKQDGNPLGVESDFDGIGQH